MPVGNADKGVGLWAGQVMLTVDNVNQYIDWWHEVLPGSGENFDHEGTLTSVVFSSGLTIGLTNYWNVTLTQIAGNRFMTWEGDTTTIHHRDEGSHEDFIKYNGFNECKNAGKLRLEGKDYLVSDGDVMYFRVGS